MAPARATLCWLCILSLSTQYAEGYIWYFNYAGISGNTLSQYRIYKSDYPSLSNDEFIWIGIQNMTDISEIVAFITVYESNDQINMNYLNFKSSIDTAYN